MTGKILSVEALNFSYGKEKILNKVSFSIDSPGVHALFGPNASGKTTLLKCLIALMRPGSGEIKILGENINNRSERFISRIVSYVPQSHHLYFPFTVFEMILMGRTPHLKGVSFGPSEEDVTIAKESIKEIGIDSISRKYFTELSGGQQQMTLIARALTQKTDVIILDEPTSALDFKNQINVWNILKKLSKNGKSVIICTHDPNYVMWFADTVTIMKNGSILSSGPPKDVMTNSCLHDLYGDICLNDNGFIRPSDLYF